MVHECGANVLSHESNLVLFRRTLFIEQHGTYLSDASNLQIKISCCSGGRRTKIHGGPKTHMTNQTKDRKNQCCIEFKFYINTRYKFKEKINKQKK
jgi:hypothetical protein